MHGEEANIADSATYACTYIYTQNKLMHLPNREGANIAERVTRGESGVSAITG